MGIGWGGGWIARAGGLIGLAIGSFLPGRAFAALAAFTDGSPGPVLVNGGAIGGVGAASSTARGEGGAALFRA